MLNLEITLAEAKQYLRIDGDSDDALLQVMIDAAKEQAEQFLCHNFTHEEIDPVTLTTIIVQDPIPASVKLGCLVCLGRWYEYRRDGVSSEGLSGESVTWQAPEEAKRLWWPYKKFPGF